jgi:hypothetical protein
LIYHPIHQLRIKLKYFDAYSFKINDSPASQNKNYNQIEVGSPSVISNEPTKIYLGKTFNERDINPLLPFEGDIIYEGRWGNTIRLGSTVIASASLSPNDWSTEGVGQNGDPIIIIKNGQGNTDKASFEPIIEDISKEPLELHKAYKWTTIDLNIKEELKELLDFISINFYDNPSKPVEFTPEIFKWLVMPPNFFKDLIVGIKCVNKLVACICGIPMDIIIFDKKVKLIQIN